MSVQPHPHHMEYISHAYTIVSMTTNKMEELESSLARISVSSPPPVVAVTSTAPRSYRTNNSKETVLLSYADNFQRQFRQLYGDRKKLFIRPANEHGVEKFVCTTLRPTHLPYQQLYSYDGCARFVAGYLNYETLNPPTELPKQLRSPTYVLETQSGNSFEHAVLLCTLLLGAGYDAYCVCGYASQQVCLLDQTSKICSSVETTATSNDQDKVDKVVSSKYIARTPRDLTSKYIKQQEQKLIDQKKAEEAKKREEEAARIAEQEKPPDDPLHGLRVHCWVLVLSGKREVAESFFIEPSTGDAHSLDWDQYHGIETLWNQSNYWINMQACACGLKSMVYDLGDATKWEYFFPNVEKPLLVLPDHDAIREELLDEDDDDSEKQQDDIRDVFELPPSWVLPISLTPHDLETQYPRGGKTLLYHKTKLEQYAEYLHRDGLVERLITYADTARNDQLKATETFVHRKDKLLTRVTCARTRQHVETFGPGREDALKEHTYYGPKSLKADCRAMVYYDHARVDGLAQRELSATDMTEHFKDRTDRLYYRKTVYHKPTKKFEPSDKERRRHVKSIVEKFHRDPSIPANDDIDQRVFLIEEQRIKLIYHLDNNRITASTREFVTPPLSGDNAQPLTLTRDMTTAYQVDTYYKEPKDRHLFEILEGLVAAQDESLSCVGAAELETEQTLSQRMQEELNIVLSVSVYDVARNEDARKHRQELEQRLADEERIRKEKERDYLAPFLARIGDPAQLSAAEKDTVRAQCLEDLRTRLVEVANIIQIHFEKETEELQQKQVWYKQNQQSLTREKEAEYISYCSAAMFRIHILEHRLNRHKTVAPQKYRELERRLRTDHRLTLGISF